MREARRLRAGGAASARRRGTTRIIAAVGSRGDALLAWTEASEYGKPGFAAVRRPGRGFRAPVEVTRRTARLLPAVGEDGTILLALSRRGRYDVRVFHGRLTRPQTIRCYSRAARRDGRADGRALVLCQRRRLETWEGRGRLRRTARLPTGPLSGAAEVDLAADGSALVTWSRAGDGPYASDRVMAALRSREGAFAAPVAITADFPAVEPVAAKLLSRRRRGRDRGDVRRRRPFDARDPARPGSDASVRQACDFDWLVIGSGFGGSVSALRLAQKGYRVGVLECGRRFADDELPKSTWDVRRYWYAPRLGLNGIFRLTIFKDVAIASGSGVGGGSLGYANTLYRAPARFYEDPQWAELERLAGPRSRRTTRRPSGCSGVATYDEDDPADDYLREYAQELGVEGTYAKTRVGVFLGEPGKTVKDPFFGGEGPDRTGCLRCGRCMVGCPHGAKNTLVKNYLYFAERAGVTIMPERTVLDIRPPRGRLRRDLRRRRGSSAAAGRSPRAASWSPPARWAPTACSQRASSTARCRTSRRGSASSCAPTARRSSPSRSRSATRP